MNNKIKKQISQNLSLWLAVAIVASLSASAMAAPASGKGRGGERPDKPRVRDVTEGTDAISAERDRKVESNIVKTLGVAKTEIASTMKEFKNDPAEYQALTRMLRQSQGKGSTENTRLLSAYLKLMNTAVGEFHMKPSVLEGRVKNWAPASKANLAANLEGAVKVASENRAVTREDAFNRSLKETGRLEKYKERCKK